MAGLVIGTNKTFVTPVLEKGVTPTGTINITTNGTHDVTNYATANVSVSGGPTYYIEKALDANNKLVGGSSIISFSGVEDVGDYGLAYAYYDNTNISGVADFSSLTTISGNYAFQSAFRGCTGITSADLHSLTTISGGFACQHMFRSCTGLTYISLPYLTTISGPNACAYMFYGCTGLTYASLPNLTTVSSTAGCNYMFSGCTGLTSANFPKLDTLTGSNALTYMFQNCTSLANIYFNALTTSSFGTIRTQFRNMLFGCSNVTLYFPSNLQTIISAMTDYPNFSGTDTTNSFTLPATE